MELNVGGDVPSSDPVGIRDGAAAETAPCGTNPRGDNENESVDIKVIFNKKKYDVNMKLNDNIGSLKKRMEVLTGVPAVTQKMMFKGATQDSQTLQELKVTQNAKFMVVGSTVNDLLAISQPSTSAQAEVKDGEESSSKGLLCEQQVHKRVLEKHGKPEDVMCGIRDVQDALPPVPLSGMYNKSGGKVRLTFKLDADQLWLGTKERTEKIALGSIKSVTSEPIVGHEEYHIMGLQLGPTEASRYWIYWVPAQYVDAIKDAVLGKWQI